MNFSLGNISWLTLKDLCPAKLLSFFMSMTNELDLIQSFQNDLKIFTSSQMKWYLVLQGASFHTQRRLMENVGFM